MKCSGVRHYTTADGTATTDIDSVTHFVPRGQRHVLLGSLLPNFNYSCTVSAEINSGEVATSNPYLFATGYKGNYVFHGAASLNNIMDTDNSITIIIIICTIYIQLQRCHNLPRSMTNPALRFNSSRHLQSLDQYSMLAWCIN